MNQQGVTTTGQLKYVIVSQLYGVLYKLLWEGALMNLGETDRLLQILKQSGKTKKIKK